MAGTSKNSVRNTSGQRDGTTLKYVSTAKGGLPIYLWVKTTRAAGKFKQEWSRDQKQWFTYP